jgi:hypothetical protein
MHKADTEDAGIQNLFEKQTQDCIHPEHSNYILKLEVPVATHCSGHPKNTAPRRDCGRESRDSQHRYVVMTEREGMKILFVSPIYRPT